MHLPSRNLRQATITLGSRYVQVAYPPSFGLWLDHHGTDAPADAVAAGWVTMSHESEPDRFRVTASQGEEAESLSFGDALAVLWERATFLLVVELGDAIALHAAAVGHGRNVVLLPGTSGAGKTWLTLWYRRQGFDLLTDELVTVSPKPNSATGDLRCSALGRPVILKTGAETCPFLQTDDRSAALPTSFGGAVVALAGRGASEIQPINRLTMVFPQYSPGAALTLTPLTPAQAGLRLLEHCVNARNLPRGGLGLAGLLARRGPAVSLVYGSADQLAGTLDVLSRQLLASAPEGDDTAALCASFTAWSAARAISASAAPVEAIPAPTTARFRRRLTVGMATYDDYDGVYFTIQALRINHPELDGALEFVVIDNNPGGRCSQALKALESTIDGYRYVPRGIWNGTAIRNAVFEEASCDLVLCVDCHILIAPGAVTRLIDYLEADPENRDLVQGPLLYDCLRRISTHLEPRWRGGMYGTWATDPRGAEVDAPAFDIPMQGMGLFACRRTAWPGFNSQFRGFGGDEGYVHEMVRRRGGRTLCLPFLRWVHRFNRPLGVPYRNRWEDRIRNYMIGFTELGIDTAEMEAHYAEVLGVETAKSIIDRLKSDLEIT